MIVPGGGFLLPSSRVPGGGRMVLDEIDTCINSVFIGPNNFKFGTETRCMVLHAIPKFGANLIIICTIMFLVTPYANRYQDKNPPDKPPIVSTIYLEPILELINYYKT